jgi:hypothetical protein
MRLDRAGIRMDRLHCGVSDLRKAALKRKADAWALWRAEGNHARGAAYLGGYAIECKLKAIAMERYGCRTLGQLAARLALPEAEVYVHSLEVLAGLVSPRFRERFRQSPVWRLFAGWVNRWRVDWRYDPYDWTREDAKRFLDAVERVYEWLDSNKG